MNDVPLLSGAQRIDGHAQEFRRIRGDLFVRLHSECGDAGRIRLFNISGLCLASPELLHDLFIEKARAFDKSLALKMAFYQLAGKGLFTSEGELWRRQRKLMAPLFSPAAVRAYAPVMNRVIASYLDTWRDGDVIDAGREMTRITMAVVGKILFDSDTFDDADELGAAIQVVFGRITDQGASLVLIARAMAGVQLLELGELPPWADKLREDTIQLLSKPFPWPTAKRRRLFAAVKTLNGKVQSMIDERRRSGGGRDDLLTRLLQAKDEDDGAVMTDKQVRDEAMTLFVAGHETTATSTTWALYFLSRNPDVYRRFQDEIATLAAGARSADSTSPARDPREPPTADEAARLQYTTGVFKEALRMYPPAFLLDRVSLEDVQLGDIQVPRHTAVFVCPYALHRRPEYWPDPDRFEPERYTPEAESRRPRLAWLPFGAGPRVCIGAGFATLEAQLILAQIAQRFDFEPADDAVIGPSYATALRPEKPVRLRLHKKQLAS